MKYLNWPNPVFGRFQNGCNKVVIESRVVQFWSEIILVISNWTRTARSVDFEITRMISVQIALHSVQLLLLIRKYLDVWKQISMPWLIKKLRLVGGYWVKIVSFKLVELKFIKTITSFFVITYNPSYKELFHWAGNKCGQQKHWRPFLQINILVWCKTFLTLAEFISFTQ